MILSRSQKMPLLLNCCWWPVAEITFEIVSEIVFAIKKLIASGREREIQRNMTGI